MGHIVVEMRTSNGVPLLPFSCSKRVFALPTGVLNARRVSRGLDLALVGVYALGLKPNFKALREVGYWL